MKTIILHEGENQKEYAHISYDGFVVIEKNFMFLESQRHTLPFKDIEKIYKEMKPSLLTKIKYKLEEIECVLNLRKIREKIYWIFTKE